MNCYLVAQKNLLYHMGLHITLRCPPATLSIEVRWLEYNWRNCNRLKYYIYPCFVYLLR